MDLEYFGTSWLGIAMNPGTLLASGKFLLTKY